MIVPFILPQSTPFAIPINIYSQRISPSLLLGRFRILRPLRNLRNLGLRILLALIMLIFVVIHLRQHTNLLEILHLQQLLNSSPLLRIRLQHPLHHLHEILSKVLLVDLRLESRQIESRKLLRMRLQFRHQLAILQTIKIILLVEVHYLLPPHQTDNRHQIVRLAVDDEGLSVRVVREHNDGQGPYIHGRRDMESSEQLLWRIVAVSAALAAVLETFVVESGDVPVDQLHFVEFEVGTHGVHHDVAHLDVMVDYSQLVDVVQCLQDLVEDQRSLLPIKLQLPQYYRFLIRKDSHGIKHLRPRQASPIAILRPPNIVSQPLHDKILPLELARPLPEEPFQHLPRLRLLILHQIDFPRTPTVDILVVVVLKILVIDLQFPPRDGLDVKTGEIRRNALDLDLLDGDGIGIDGRGVKTTSAVVRRVEREDGRGEGQQKKQQD